MPSRGDSGGDAGDQPVAPHHQLITRFEDERAVLQRSQPDGATDLVLPVDTLKVLDMERTRSLVLAAAGSLLASLACIHGCAPVVAADE